MSILQESVVHAYNEARTDNRRVSQRLNLGPMPTGTHATVRFLPRLGHENGLPGRTAWYIQLPFEGGIINSDNDTDEPASVRVISQKTFGLNEYIVDATKWAWNGSADEKEKIAKPYWHRPAHLYGCLVCNLPFVEPTVIDNPVRILSVGKQLQDQIVSTGLSNVEMEYAVVDFDHGRDFTIKKSQTGGQWANYTSSSFGFRERPLSKAERDNIEQFGLPDLEAEIGGPYDADTLAMVKAMFHASLAGEAFDAKAFPKFRAWPAFARGDSKKPMGPAPRGIDPQTQALLDQINQRNTSVLGK